ncbi:hypothetical protein [Celeribacter sp. ULVN23_4]
MDFDRYSDLIDAYLRPALERGAWPGIQAAVETILSRARKRMGVAGISEDQVERAVVALHAHLENLIRDHASGDNASSEEDTSDEADEETRAPVINAEAIIAALRGISTSAEPTLQRRQARMNLSHDGFDRARIDAADEALRAAIQMRSRPEPQSTTSSQTAEKPEASGPARPEPEQATAKSRARKKTQKAAGQKAARPKASRPKRPFPKRPSISAPHLADKLRGLKARASGAFGTTAAKVETRLPTPVKQRLGQGAGRKVLGLSMATVAVVVGIGLVRSDPPPAPTYSSGLRLTATRTPSAPKKPEAEKWVAIHRFSGMYEPDIAVGDTVHIFYAHSQEVLEVYENSETHRLVMVDTSRRCAANGFGNGVETRILTPRAVKVKLTGDELGIGHDTPQEAIAATIERKEIASSPNSPSYFGNVWIMTGDLTERQWEYVEVTPDQEGAFRSTFNGCYPL